MVLPFAAPQLLGALLLVSPMGGKLGPSKPGREKPQGEAPSAPKAKTTRSPKTAAPQRARRSKAPRPSPAPTSVEPEPEDADLDAVPLEVLDEAPPSLEVPEAAQIEYESQGPSLQTRLPVQPPVLVRSVPPQTRAAHKPEAKIEDAGAAPEPDTKASWKDDLSVGAFVDTYAGVNALLPDPGTPNALRAFDGSNGFALHWAGVDAEYGGEVAGGTVSLRFGPSAAAYNGGDSDYGLEYVKQAYVSFSPRRTKGRLSFDLGKFDTLYGAEVADSQANFNYTRGALNWLGQPFFHTGVKMGIQVSDKLELNAMVVNGWNTSLDNNRGKSGGVQLAWSPSDRFGAYLGYLVGAEGDRDMTVTCESDTALDGATGECVDSPGADAAEVSVAAKGVERRMRHFADLVITASVTERLELSINGDLGYDETINNPITGAFAPSIWYGAALGARVSITERVATAARGEYYSDLQGFTTPVPVSLGTGTLTLEFRPADMLIFKLDSRYEQATDTIYVGRDATGSDRQLTFTLGAVIHTP